MAAPILLVAGTLFLIRATVQGKARRLVLAAVAALATCVVVSALVPFTAPPTTDLRIVVHKARRELLLVSNSETVLHCRIALGSKPVGTKLQEGDLRTPEGVYRVCEKDVCDASRNLFHKWLGISYPDAGDGLRGLLSGRIIWTEYWALRWQSLNHRRPLYNTWLGGNIGIHGGGARRDWTLGCIALDNRDIDELYSRVPLGTPVSILP